MAKRDLPGSSADMEGLSPPERRLVGQALSYWGELRGKRPMPSVADLPLGAEEARAGRGLWPHLYVVALESQIGESVLSYAGRTLATACGKDLEGARAADVLPPALWEKLSDVFQAAAAMEKPVLASGPFVTGDNRDALFRGIVMPLGDGEGDVRHLLGAFGYTYSPR
jgi:hypothetical protein